MWENIILGFATAATLTNLAYCFMGVFIGTLIGVLPGLGSLAAISMLLPVTFYLEPTTALIALGGIYYGAEYGGSIASILLNLPGTPSNAVTCLDGNPMAKQGKAGRALFTTAIASFTGGTLGVIALMGFGPAIAELGLKFGPGDYFALMVLGLVAAVTVGTGSAVRSMIMVVLGLLLGTVGTDVTSGDFRYTFDLLELRDGVSLVAIAMGLFGISEVANSIGGSGNRGAAQKVSLRSMLPDFAWVRQVAGPILRGSSIGGFLGALPGAGTVISAFLAYAVELRMAKDRSIFGKGAIQGLAAPEAANNAAAQTAFIPTLTIGIPGSATMSIMLGALMIHGISPGPMLVTDHPQMFWGLIASFWIGNLFLLLLNIPLIGLWVRVLQFPYKFIYPIVIALICIGVYSMKNSVFDVGIVLLFGGLGFFFQKVGYGPANLILGFVLGPMLEENLRRAMLLARGDATVLLTGQLSGPVLGISGLLLIWAAVSGMRSMIKQRRAVDLPAGEA
ncbi:tripartite tricarboxylate transporter permease [Paracoccus saliphilus]|uniref:TctA family transporter n=1 Tax=Paracoccus saliphilus TaxID=405559 RepID=A0AA45W653_9RHOB|nr:tripartite tricarboxylate transporter permease [Paracoccus saliphilus]WCR01532.1 tripartite tricarboxylate transporter permease [Paracoccus saliphilus]SIS99185.1 TctA family transporter [Paracoccus saliphilus]